MRVPRMPLALAAGLLVCSPLLAQPLQCGNYLRVDAPGDPRFLSIDSATDGRWQESRKVSRPLRLHQQGQALTVYDLEYGVAEPWQRADDDTLVDASGTAYALANPRACATPSTPRPAGCVADIDRCFDQRYDASSEQLRQWCHDEYLPFACAELIARYQRDADGGAPEPEPEVPAACRDGEPGASPAACASEALRIFGQDMARMATSLYDDDAPLPAVQLDELARMCTQTASARVCEASASKLWTAGQLTEAGTTLQQACRFSGDESTCQQAAAVATLTAADERWPSADTLPCGRLHATTGLMDTLTFGDGGQVEAPFGSRLQARLDAGQVRIRHDKGGDFVLRPVGGGRWVGMDSWNRYAVYTPEGDTGHCTAPVAVREVPLPNDCPTLLAPGGAQACCAAGRLQGCNAAGHQAALAGDWEIAGGYYRQVCAAGIRAGCENLVRSHGQGAVAQAPAWMGEFCAGDPLHVACEINRGNPWGIAGLERLVDDILREIEAETPAE